MFTGIIAVTIVLLLLFSAHQSKKELITFEDSVIFYLRRVLESILIIGASLLLILAKFLRLLN